MKRLTLAQVIAVCICLSVCIPLAIISTSTSAAQTKPKAIYQPMSKRVWQDGVNHRFYWGTWYNHYVHLRAEKAKQLASKAHAIQVRRIQAAAIEHNIQYNEWLASTTTTTTPSYSYTQPTTSYTTPSYSAPTSTGNGNPTGIYSCIAQAESGGNPATNTGNGYYGEYQYLPSTWLHYCGCSDPIASDYSGAFQTSIAQKTPISQFSDPCTGG